MPAVLPEMRLVLERDDVESEMNNINIHQGPVVRQLFENLLARIQVLEDKVDALERPKQA